MTTDPARPIPIGRLLAFLSNPAKFLARTRLGIPLPEEDAPAEESEPFTLDGLNRYHIGALLLDGCLAGRDPDELYPAVRAAGRLPHGPAGDVLFRRLGAAGAAARVDGRESAARGGTGSARGRLRDRRASADRAAAAGDPLWGACRCAVRS